MKIRIRDDSNGHPHMANNRGQRDRFIKDPRHAELIVRLGLATLEMRPFDSLRRDDT